MVNILIGILLIIVGAPLLNSISEIISAITELIKANINERIARHNKLSEGETHSGAIGFATIFEEEDDHE